MLVLRLRHRKGRTPPFEKSTRKTTGPMDKGKGQREEVGHLQAGLGWVTLVRDVVPRTHIHVK